MSEAAKGPYEDCKSAYKCVKLLRLYQKFQTIIARTSLKNFMNFTLPSTQIN